MPTPNPVAFTIFGLDIMWYGIIIACAIILATLVTYLRAPSHGISRERVLDFALVCIPAGVVGARAYYVIFNWSYYNGDIWKIINTREGGLAIHGGLILGFLAAWLVCKVTSVNPLNALDTAVPAIALAQAIGRWGNYFNGEAHGGPTDLPWAIVVDGQKVHPTFLYESIWCLLLFLILLVVDSNRRFDGQTVLVYVMLYSLERFFVEYLRTDSLMLFGSLKQAMVLSAVCFVVAFLLYRALSSREKVNGKIFYGSYSKYKGKFKK